MSLIQKAHTSMQKKQYYQANKELILARVKKYYYENKNEILENKKEFYSEHKNEITNKINRYNEENREKVNERKKPLNKIAYYKRTYNLYEFDNEYISDILDIKYNQNIKNGMIHYLVYVKEMYSIKI